MGKRRKARELALKMLFQVDVGKLPPDSVVATTFEELKVDPETREYAEALFRRTLESLPELDADISRAAKEWRLERFASVDRNVLRLALCEMRQFPETPVSVVINEAVEMAKKYSTAESGKFVNGILGTLAREMQKS